MYIWTDITHACAELLEKSRPAHNILTYTTEFGDVSEEERIKMTAVEKLKAQNAFKITRALVCTLT